MEGVRFGFEMHLDGTSKSISIFDDQFIEMTAEVKILKTKTAENTPWRSISVVTVMAVCTAIQGGLYYSSIWPYLRSLNSEVTDIFLGFVMSMYSFGQILSAPLIGWSANKIGTIRPPVTVCILCQVTGNVVYFLAQEAPSAYAIYVVVLSRFILGIGSVNLVLLDTYASTASLPRHKSRTISLVTGGVALGISIGPGTQLFFTPLGKHGIELFNTGFSINMYTAPAVAAIFFNLIALICVSFVFEEVYAGLNSQPREKLTDTPAKKLKIDWIAIFVCHATGFVHYFTFSHVETLGTNFVMTVMGYSEENAIQYYSICFTLLSIVELGFYGVYVFGKLEKYGSTRMKCVFGLIGFFIFYVTTFSWSFLPGEMKKFDNSDLIAFRNFNGSEPIGCNTDTYSWCESVKPVNPWVYITALSVVIGLSFGILNTTLSTLFSDVLGPKKQGTQMGFFHMTRNNARMLGPLAITGIYESFGPRFAWMLQLCMLTFNLVIFAVFYHRMVPMAFPKHQTHPVDDQELTPTTQKI
ncbi:unnamed protein product [Bursaphelenchus xylophilus]|uniref:(pine wood nematode) hypothetical protein n=1 Tax=Bursaphelenchus xylophilus TaxID=6326 RepID=A0A1I7RJL4_BURXY|nr:unnamed protein product [Bursaphelenchus xylophilus]CAG9128940.1 unnamed protein product [Bursaphelenchus xylophilus]